MNPREELLERQVSGLVDRLCGIKAIAQLACEGVGNGVDSLVIQSALLTIEREADTVMDLLGDLSIPADAMEQPKAANANATVTALPSKRRSPDETEPDHAA